MSENIFEIPYAKISLKATPDLMKLNLSSEPINKPLTNILVVGSSDKLEELTKNLEGKYQGASITVAKNLLKASENYLATDFELCLIEHSFDDADISAFIKDTINLKPKHVSICILITNDRRTKNIAVDGEISDALNENEQKILEQTLMKRVYLQSMRDLGEKVESGSSAQSAIFKLLMKGITKSTPTELVHHDVVMDVANQIQLGKPVKDRRIAKGNDPTTGHNGKLLLLVKAFSGEGEFTPDKYDQVDFKLLHLFDNVQAEQPVARLYKPAKGEDGVDVFGAKIEGKTGSDASLEISNQFGRKAEAGTNYEIITSLVDGFLRQSGSRLEMVQDFVINGDLDLSFGHIDFVGSVTVQGNVLPGFSIKARLDIKVRGSVEEAQLISSEGNIEISGFAHGSKDSRIVAAKSVNLFIANNLTVEAGQNIVVKKEAVNSQLRALGYIQLPTAVFMGGKAFVVAGAEFGTIGTELEMLTEVQVCNNIEMTSDYCSLVSNIEEHQKVLDLLALHLGPYAKNASRIQLLANPLKTKLSKLIQKYEQVTVSLSKLNERKVELLSSANQLDKVQINIVKLAHGNVEIRSGDKEFIFKDSKPGPFSLVYSSETQEFICGDYAAIEIPEST